MQGHQKRKQAFLRLYDFSSCVCDQIGAKEADVLTRKWEALTKQHKRCSVLTVRLKVPPSIDLHAYQSKSVLTKAQCEAPDVASVPMNDVDSRDDFFAHNQGSSRQTKEALPIPDAVSGSVADFLVQAQPGTVAAEPNESNTFVSIAPDHAQFRRELAAQQGRYVPNKWERVHAEFKKLYPQADLCKNALRCRLRGVKTNITCGEGRRSYL